MLLQICFHNFLSFEKWEFMKVTEIILNSIGDIKKAPDAKNLCGYKVNLINERYIFHNWPLYLHGEFTRVSWIRWHYHESKGDYSVKYTVNKI